MELTAENVSNVFHNCSGSYSNEDPLVVKGIRISAEFSPSRLSEQRDQITSMVNQLPPMFRYGGSSFMSMCMANTGRQWGEHSDCERLLLLGLGIDIIRFTKDRSEWSRLPGGMPEIMVKIN